MTAASENAPMLRAAAWLVPEEKRDHVLAVADGCALLRRTILAGQGAGGGGGGCCGTSGELLDRVRAKVSELCDGRLELPEAQFRDREQQILAGMSVAVRRFEIPRSDLFDFVDACAADAITTRYATWASLRRHCEGVGGNATAMAACVLGMMHSGGRAAAVAAGAAGRLASILRALPADLARDRVYPPIEMLARQRISDGELREGIIDARGRAIVLELVARGRELLVAGGGGLVFVAPDGSRAAAGLVLALAAASFDQVESSGAGALQRTPPASVVRIVRRIGDAWRMARREPADVVPRAS